MTWRLWREENNSSARINLSAVPYAQNEYYEPIMLERTDEAVVTDTVLPELAQRTLESFADLLWVIEFPDPLVEKFENAASDRFIQLIEFSLRCGLDLNRPFL
jgi:hypothetical protein